MTGGSINAGATPRLAATRQALRYLLVAVLLLAAIAAVHFYAERQLERTARETSERLNVALGKTAITTALEGVFSDLTYLAKRNQALGLFTPDDPVARTRLGEDFLVFSAEKRIYDQVRFLDLNGQELVRINFNAGQPRQVPADDLQNKAERYYFETALALKRGEVYVSPLDLNVERGGIELPAKPMMRLATPVHDSAGRRSGILLLNYLGERLLATFRTATANISGHVSLLNADGYWMASPRREDEWGFMRGDRTTFATRHPQAWQRIRSGTSGQFANADSLFTFATIEAAGGDAGHHGPEPWKVVARVPHADFATAPGNFMRRHAALYATMLLLLTIGAGLLGAATVRHRRAEDRVEFERRFRKILEGSSLCGLAMDLDGRVTFCNDALSKLVGWTSRDLIGKDWVATLVAPECRDECRQILAGMTSRSEQPSRHESWILARDGARRLIAWHEAPVTGADGALAGMNFLGEDITEGREIEEQNRQLSQAVEQSPATVMITDPQGRIEYVNAKFTRLTGYTLDEVRGMNPRILKSGNKSAEEYQGMWETIASGGEWRGIFQNRKKTGEFYWEAATISAVRNRDGEIAHYLAVKEDITERRRLEERFRHCVESAPSAVLLCDRAGRMILVNREAERLFGYTRDELVGQSINQLVPEEMRSEHDEHREGFHAQPTSRSMGVSRDLHARHRDGHLIPVQIGLHAVESEEGPLVIASVVDITVRKQLEEQLQQRNQEIAHTQALAAIGRMANMVAHDIRNPLSSVKMGLQIIGKQHEASWSREDKELKEIALEQVRYMEEILDDLLSYSRESLPSPEWLQIDEVLDAAVLLAQRYIDERNVHVTTHYQAGLPKLHGDANGLRRAFCNLIVNGIQATEGNDAVRPEITVSTHLELAPDRPKIRIRICDNGRGLTPEQELRVFEPFFTTRASGTGLGLAIVKRIIEQHDGTIELFPGEISGSCASIILPTGPMSVSAAETPPETAAVIAEDLKAEADQ